MRRNTNLTQRRRDAEKYKSYAEEQRCGEIQILRRGAETQRNTNPTQRRRDAEKYKSHAEAQRRGEIQISRRGAETRRNTNLTQRSRDAEKYKSHAEAQRRGEIQLSRRGAETQRNTKYISPRRGAETQRNTLEHAERLRNALFFAEPQRKINPNACVRPYISADKLCAFAPMRESPAPVSPLRLWQSKCWSLRVITLNSGFLRQYFFGIKPILHYF
jgi:hypothetical protein